MGPPVDPSAGTIEGGTNSCTVMASWPVLVNKQKSKVENKFASIKGVLTLFVSGNKKSLLFLMWRWKKQVVGM